MAAIVDYLTVWHQINNFQLRKADDRVIWRWSSDGSFTVRLAYNALHIPSHPIPGCDLLWETWAPLRVKLFMWLALRGRQWTPDRQQQHGLDANENCFL
jgi:hypothetical protein